MYKHAKYSGVNLIPAVSIYLLFSSNTLAAPPNLWWDHIYNLDLTQTTCVEKAMSLMKPDSYGKITQSEDSVKARGENSRIIVECLPSRNKVIVMILVSSNNIQLGETIFNSLKTGMRN